MNDSPIAPTSSLFPISPFMDDQMEPLLDDLLDIPAPPPTYVVGGYSDGSSVVASVPGLDLDPYICSLLERGGLLGDMDTMLKWNRVKEAIDDLSLSAVIDGATNAQLELFDSPAPLTQDADTLLSALVALSTPYGYDLYMDVIPLRPTTYAVIDKEGTEHLTHAVKPVLVPQMPPVEAPEVTTIFHPNLDKALEPYLKRFQS
jgi:hypothetical protein